MAAYVAGILFLLVATGSYRFAPWGEAGIADAKFSLRIPNELFSFHDNDFNTFVDGAVHGYGLQVVFYDGSFDKPLLPVGWMEDFNMDHVYTAYVTGDGTPLQFFISDTLYSDNSGFITVEVIEQP